MADNINISSFGPTFVLTVPVGPFPVKGRITEPNPNQPYDILYICTGFIIFEFRGSGDDERTGVLTTHGPNERQAVPILAKDGSPLRLVSPITNQRMSIQNSAVTASLARINNQASDNGVWTVDVAEVLDPLPDSAEPELFIQLIVQGDDGIKLERVSYTAFIQTSPIT